MPIIPMKQTITVTKAGKLDGWAAPTPGEEITYKARVTEETNVVTNKLGEEAVAKLRITLDKLADISYDDVITYTNELDVTVTKKPLSIVPKRMLNGRAIVTEVFV
ncbi:hypothetical protein BK120_08330 [Paenibacillus sp. FSL A5-0031]|uniref:hypothetical protein n=1 Tax=Paenibacillus sp. FSL A5-0031 TaxID=1920420 RepID=UPI00096C34A8|nr:hypothetical protein [Paenibacillus sp. FSL A5-0031]OME86920.1 hypothetical protein BK120_08330 [Paenibacillus sp. FSL A5-0031]